MRTLIIGAAIICASALQAQRVPPSLATAIGKFAHGVDTHYVSAFVDLNGDGKPEAIIYMDSQDWCGTGGCSMLIWKQDGKEWKLVTSVPATRPPIRVLTHRTNGWQDLAVWAGGGSTFPGYEAELCFDGNTYPVSTTVPPARHGKGKSPGKTVLR
jgi:hypothetical protein